MYRLEKPLFCFDCVKMEENFSSSLQGPVTEKVKVAQSCPTLCDPMDYSVSSWSSPGQSTEVGSRSLFQGIFPTQGRNPGLLPSQADSLPAELPGKPGPLLLVFLIWVNSADVLCAPTLVCIFCLWGFSSSFSAVTATKSQVALGEYHFSYESSRPG